ncbi:hypothetical protein D3C81_938640 [compost metagenome]
MMQRVISPLTAQKYQVSFQTQEMMIQSLLLLQQELLQHQLLKQYLLHGQLQQTMLV